MGLKYTASVLRKKAVFSPETSYQPTWLNGVITLQRATWLEIVRQIRHIRHIFMNAMTMWSINSFECFPKFCQYCVHPTLLTFTTSFNWWESYTLLQFTSTFLLETHLNIILKLFSTNKVTGKGVQNYSMLCLQIWCTPYTIYILWYTQCETLLRKWRKLSQFSCILYTLIMKSVYALWHQYWL